MNYSIVVFGTSVFKRTDFQKKKKTKHTTMRTFPSPSVAFTCPRGVHLQYPHFDRIQLRTASQMRKKQSFFDVFVL